MMRFNLKVLSLKKHWLINKHLIKEGKGGEWGREKKRDKTNVQIILGIINIGFHVKAFANNFENLEKMDKFLEDLNVSEWTQ